MLTPSKIYAVKTRHPQFFGGGQMYNFFLTWGVGRGVLSWGDGEMAAGRALFGRGFALGGVCEVRRAGYRWVGERRTRRAIEERLRDAADAREQGMGVGSGGRGAWTEEERVKLKPFAVAVAGE
jgi:hypothetical protein